MHYSDRVLKSRMVCRGKHIIKEGVLFHPSQSGEDGMLYDPFFNFRQFDIAVQGVKNASVIIISVIVNHNFSFSINL
ncbi:hypothetical protein B0A81_18595 [Flavobacterium plurextorum]|uniref:Uncharacterized protein n=1 Tax=Flavobacterium plurextorum TaxID=1114867 RepID=A0ABX4CR70_9FLAO|nr:hypothetical protein B0A81_18595 [Flavobacterium plurextorum]